MPIKQSAYSPHAELSQPPSKSKHTRAPHISLLVQKSRPAWRVSIRGRKISLSPDSTLRTPRKEQQVNPALSLPLARIWIIGRLREGCLSSRVIPIYTHTLSHSRARNSIALAREKGRKAFSIFWKKIRDSRKCTFAHDSIRRASDDFVCICTCPSSPRARTYLSLSLCMWECAARERDMDRARMDNVLFRMPVASAKRSCISNLERRARARACMGFYGTWAKEKWGIRDRFSVVGRAVCVGFSFIFRESRWAFKYKRERGLANYCSFRILWVKVRVCFWELYKRFYIQR